MCNLASPCPSLTDFAACPLYGELLAGKAKRSVQWGPFIPLAPLALLSQPQEVAALANELISSLNQYLTPDVSSHMALVSAANLLAFPLLTRQIWTFIHLFVFSSWQTILPSCLCFVILGFLDPSVWRPAFHFKQLLMKTRCPSPKVEVWLVELCGNKWSVR